MPNHFGVLFTHRLSKEKLEPELLLSRFGLWRQNCERFPNQLALVFTKALIKGARSKPAFLDFVRLLAQIVHGTAYELATIFREVGNLLSLDGAAQRSGRPPS